MGRLTKRVAQLARDYRLFIVVAVGWAAFQIWAASIPEVPNEVVDHYARAVPSLP